MIASGYNSSKEAMGVTDYRTVLKRHREQKGLSQNQLAKQLGLTQTFVSEIERGRKNPSLEQFFRICEALDFQIFPEDA